MYIKYIIALIFTCQLSLLAIGQHTVSGFVKDANTNEVLVGAYVINLTTGTGTSTNNYGYFSLVCESKVNLQFSFIGYEKALIPLVLESDTLLNISIKEGTELSEVVVKAPKRTEFNTATLSVKELNRIPSLGGKPDILKAMQTLPGIQGQSEGSSLLIVRGGSPGENLYLLDNTPIIYVNHLGGVISVFNPDMINSISIYKGGFPAEYGGKLSSVVNIAQRRGSPNHLKGSFSIGLTDASLLLEGPLGKKASFILTGRKTLFDVLFYAMSSALDNNEFKMWYGFHDVNAKVTWKPNANNSLYFNIYQGDDYLNFWSKPDHVMQNAKTHSQNVWGNWLFSTGWNRTVSPKLFLENNLSYTRYRLKDKQTISDTSQYETKSVFKAAVQDVSLRSVWNYQFKPKWSVKAGLQPSLLIHSPYVYNVVGIDTINEQSKISTLQTALFLDNKLKLSKNIELNLGLRAVNYSTTSSSDSWLEPRVSIITGLNPNHKLNLTYMQVRQNSHLLHTTGSIMNNEVWIPATKDIPSAQSWQSSVGWMGQFMDDMFSTELNVYYKEMSNLATYKEGYINLKGDIDWPSRIETGGKGTSYGVEFFIKKNYGNWSGSLGYAWSHTTRQFDNLNYGKEYLYEYDRPHSLTFMLNRKLGKKWDFNLTWVYQTGLPYTPVLGRQYTPSLNLDYDTDDMWVQNPVGQEFYYEALIYGERNSARMSDYHRLDIGLNYTKQTKRNRKAVWSFSIYNVYNRQNPSYYYYNNNDTDEIHRPELNNGFKPLSMYQMSLFPILPSFSYKLYFNKGDNKTPFKNRFRRLLYHE